ncbi:crossover junction endodeoxyribonuclease RuvC [Candidatus Microgenomates bacterium]|jgi:crossover junction endodeoxyribonuclease RuvC|nr:MAG: crossover junction endodeoxyribonuclease RuvC [Candidatus Microgenomates bacterium]
MKILGIDPGTATIGIGIVECNGESVCSLHSGWIQTSKDDSPEKRLSQIHLETTSLIKEHKPDVVAIERLFFFINYKTAMAVSESIGVIKLACQNQGIPISTFAPLEIKSTVAGNGKAKKDEMQVAVKKMLNIKTPKKKKTHFDDLCDALAVAICYAKKNLMQPETGVGYNKKRKLGSKLKTTKKKGYKGITKRRKPSSAEAAEGEERG